MAFFEKLKDWLMPPEPDDEEIETEEVGQKQEPKVKAAHIETGNKAVVNGPVQSYTQNSRFNNTTSAVNFAPEAQPTRPKFKLRTANTPALNMEVHVPQSFDQVKTIGDQLKRKNAVIVNYEMLATHDQRRICDFLNGLTYVLDGDVKRISNNIVLYVPDGVDVSDAMLAVA